MIDRIILADYFNFYILPEEIHEETELERIEKRNKRLSTDNVKVECQNGKININFPQEVLDEIDRIEKRNETIKEFRETPKYHGIATVGHCLTKDIDAFLYDVKDVCDNYLNSVLDSTTVNMIDAELKHLFNEFLHGNRYSMYI